MRVGLISDVHGNKPALTAVLEALGDVDLLINAGDVVGYNPWPAACLETVRERESYSVRGNHDRAVGSSSGFRFNSLAQAGVEYAREQLSADQRAWLDALPETRTVLDGAIRVAHGHPDDPDRYTYPEEFSADMLEEESLLVLGHTHVQHAETYDTGAIVNPGSVGQPRDNDPRAAYAVVETDTWDVTLDRVSYDVAAVQDAVSAAGLPREIATRLSEGR